MLPEHLRGQTRSKKQEPSKNDQFAGIEKQEHKQAVAKKAGSNRNKDGDLS